MATAKTVNTKVQLRVVPCVQCDSPVPTELTYRGKNYSVGRTDRVYCSGSCRFAARRDREKDAVAAN